MTSGCWSRISRILRVAASPSCSESVMGIEARIQKLPSSSAGRNSLPSRSPASADQRPERPADADREGAVRQGEAQRGIVEPCSKRTTNVSVSFTCSGSSSDASTGVTVKVEINAPASA